MIYLTRNDIVIREFQESDIEPIVSGEIAQGWKGATREKYDLRLQDRSEGKCICLCAVYREEPVGYINLYFQAEPPFDRTNWPEIVDFGVLEKYQRIGIGSALMDAVESLAAQRSDTVCLGVGMHSGYGSAQRMYVKRGYIPDGSGVWFNGEKLEQYAPCVNDDSLILFMSKKLSL